MNINSNNDTFRDAYNRSRYFMVSLFSYSWEIIKDGNFDSIKQNHLDGNIHYKREFLNEENNLINGWDTKIGDFFNRISF